MPMYTVRCAAGHEHDVLAKWRDVTPCPTCGLETQRLWKGARTVIGDEWPGGKTFEHISHEPITVYSKTELKRQLDAHGLRHTDRYHPHDGPDWRQGIDATTLDNARVLVGRQAERPTPVPTEAPLKTLQLAVRDVYLEQKKA
jgi:hypothetical protein